MIAMNADTTAAVESVIAKIRGGALGSGYTARVEDIAEGEARIHVTRHGRQDRGYVRVEGSAIDLAELDIAGMSASRVRDALTSA